MPRSAARVIVSSAALSLTLGAVPAWAQPIAPRATSRVSVEASMRSGHGVGVVKVDRGAAVAGVAVTAIGTTQAQAKTDGTGYFTFRDESNASRSLKITYHWKEDLPIKISKVFPLEGEGVVLTARVLNLGKSKTKKVPVAFYLGDPKKGGTEIGRDFIGSIGPGEMASANVKWKATRKIQATSKTGPYPGAAIFVTVDPDHSIPESNKENNTSFRIIKVLNLPEVYIPSESFIRFDKKKDYPDILTIKATIRNFSNYFHRL